MQRAGCPSVRGAPSSGSVMRGGVWTITTALTGLPHRPSEEVSVVLPLTASAQPVVFGTKAEARSWGEEIWLAAWRLLNQEDLPKLTPVRLPTDREVDLVPVTIEGFPARRRLPSEHTPDAHVGRLVTARLQVGIVQVKDE